jgi:hypothetical protein
MGIFSRRQDEVLPEKALVKDHLGLWDIDVDEAFRLYRQGWYSYHGPVTINDGVYHQFVSKRQYE